LLPFAAFLNPSGYSNVERFISGAQILRASADLLAAAELPTLYVRQGDAAAATKLPLVLGNRVGLRHVHRRAL
jgi:hypothetical protein